MSAHEESLLDTFLIKGTTYWLGLTDLTTEGSRLKPSLLHISRVFNTLSIVQGLIDGRKVTKLQTMLTGLLINLLVVMGLTVSGKLITEATLAGMMLIARRLFMMVTSKKCMLSVRQINNCI